MSLTIAELTAIRDLRAALEEWLKKWPSGIFEERKSLKIVYKYKGRN